MQRDFAILPRRKAKDQNPVGRAPVLLTKPLLEKYFGMSLSSASKELVRSAHMRVFRSNLSANHGLIEILL